MEKGVLTTDSIVGAWRLVSYTVTAADGTISYPFGRDAVGYYLFTDDGYAAVAIMNRDRPRYQTDDLHDGTLEQRAAAAAGYVSYTGRYEVQGDRLLIHPEVSLFPNWAGTEQVRIMEFDGEMLTLGTPPMSVAGARQTPRLVWERAREER